MDKKVKQTTATSAVPWLETKMSVDKRVQMTWGLLSLNSYLQKLQK